MDLKDLGNLAGMQGGTGGIPNMSKLGGSFSGLGLGMPEYVKSNEFGVRTSRTFDGVEDYELPSLDIDSVTFHSGAILDGIIVVYSDGSTVHHGGSGGGAHKISLAGDSIKRIYGVCKADFSGHKVLTNICLETASGKKYGPYGSQSNGERLEISKQGHKLVALFGSADGNYISSLGAYLVKL